MNRSAPLFVYRLSRAAPQVPASPDDSRPVAASPGAMRTSMPIIMCVNAGYVDTASFLALLGLFTAHVTGNLVTFGVAMVLGTSGALAKLLSVPVFCCVVVCTRIFSHSLPLIGLPVLRTMLTIKFCLLVVAAVLAIRFGPFTHGDGLPAIATGMVLVAAMAIQNAAHRTYLDNAPSTTLMTGSLTQIMIDIADLIRGVPPDARVAAKARLKLMSASVLAFALGCAGGALVYARFQTFCFVIPPLLAVPPLFMRVTREAAYRGLFGNGGK